MLLTGNAPGRMLCLLFIPRYNLFQRNWLPKSFLILLKMNATRVAVSLPSGCPRKRKHLCGNWMGSRSSTQGLWSGTDHFHSPVSHLSMFSLRKPRSAFQTAPSLHYNFFSLTINLNRTPLWTTAIIGSLKVYSPGKFIESSADLKLRKLYECSTEE